MVAYDRQFLRLSFLFAIDGTDEVAQTGVKLTGDTNFDAASSLAEIGSTEQSALYEAYWTMRSAVGALLFADYATYTGIKVAACGTDGLYLTDPVVYEPASPYTTGQTGVSPNESLVLSLRTATTIGRAVRGRMYLPYMVAAPEATSPLISSATAAAVAEAGADMIVDINGVGATLTNDFVVAIMSKLGTGTTRGVTKVAVGRLNDVQNRRRRQLSEEYFEWTVGA